jgi:lysophospholipase L1-like esterase
MEQIVNTNSDRQQISVVFFGDSITEGQYIEHYSRWTDILARALQTSFGGDNGVDIRAFNRGISGETSRQGLMRYAQDVQDISPDVLTIQFGLNDCNHWVTDKGHPRVSQNSFRSNLEEMIDRARIFGSKHITLMNNYRTLRTSTLTGGKTLEEERVVYNRILKEVAHDCGVGFFDIDDWFKKIDEKQYADYLLPEPDLLHLSELGHEHYASGLLPIIQSSIREIVDNRQSFKMSA